MNMELLRDVILNKFPDARLCSGNREIMMRCRFCGDSQTDSNAKHLYVKIDGDIPWYNCFKCNAKGVMNGHILKDFMGQYDDNDLRILAAINSDVEKLQQSTLRTIKTADKKYRIVNTNTTSSEAIRKLEYINNRLGLNLTVDDACRDKIVLNLMELLSYNNIQAFKYPYDIMERLSDVSIGFLSMDNGLVNMRNMSRHCNVLPDYLDNHYNNYNIFNTNAISMYTIPSICDTASIQPIHIHVAEGPFDILSICYNLRGNNRMQNIYVAICGKKYTDSLIFIQQYGIINCIYHIYPDNDVPNNDWNLQNLIGILHSLNISVYVHRNQHTNQKDFGVCNEYINESCTLI